MKKTNRNQTANFCQSMENGSPQPANSPVIGGNSDEKATSSDEKSENSDEKFGNRDSPEREPITAEGNPSENSPESNAEEISGSNAENTPETNDLEARLAEAENRGYLRGRNERIEELMKEPTIYQQQSAPPKSDKQPDYQGDWQADSQPMILNNPHISIWDK